MIIKQLVLNNFRQFKGDNHIINFATDKVKNVTIVMADGGVGKTTLSQSIQWVLYGSTDAFKNKQLLNLRTQQDLGKNQRALVSVTLRLEHTGIDYVINRSQIVEKDNFGAISIKKPELKIEYKKTNGVTEIIKDLNILQQIVESIMPQELSKYFFFDGERIEKMSNDIRENKKNQNFSEAVQGLLGLKPLLKAMEHLNGGSDSVIGKYNSEIVASGNSEIQQLRKNIDQGRSESTKNQEIKENCTVQIRHFKDRRDAIRDEIAKIPSVGEKQKLYNVLEQEVKKLSEQKNSKLVDYFKKFGYQAHQYFSRPLINKILEELSEQEITENGVPDIQSSTIEFLLKRKKCLCGCDLSNTKSANVMTLHKELEYIPPQSLRTYISQFVINSRGKLEYSSNYKEDMFNLVKEIRHLKNEMDNKASEMINLNKDMIDNSNKILHEMKKTEREYDEAMSRFQHDSDNACKELGRIEPNIEKWEKEIENKALIDMKNRQTEIFRQYAKSCYTSIESAYKHKEKKVREDLKTNINELFTKIYSSGLEIDVDEKYNINVFICEIENNNDNVDQSTSQSYSIIFAFIVGIISMAADAKDELLGNSSESYPLVMDAPLSAFDQRRIKNICELIPTIARQVIIFIKDTDGQIAKDNLDCFIGYEYKICSRDESLIDSYIMEVTE